MPADFGTHRCLNSSGLVHASNTMRAEPLKLRVTTSSLSDFRSTLVRLFMGAGPQIPKEVLGVSFRASATS